MPRIGLRACGRPLGLEYGDDETGALLLAGFGGMAVPAGASGPPAPLLRIDRAPSSPGYVAADGAGNVTPLEDAGHVLFHVDKQIALTLQLERPDLFFLHAAVVSLGGRAAVLAAPSGTGKSTLTLALVNQGFDYLSDELAPIDVTTLTVHPYPRALCLKSPPPAPYRVPAGALETGSRFHVPVEALPGVRRTGPLPVAAFVFLRRETGGHAGCEPMSPAAAAAHLVANALNAAAHPDVGLEAAETLTREIPCFAIDSTSLDAACATVKNLLSPSVASGGGP